MRKILKLLVIFILLFKSLDSNAGAIIKPEEIKCPGNYNLIGGAGINIDSLIIEEELPNEDEKMIISLEKFEYKEYEPVVVKIAYINNTKDTIEFHNEFEEDMGTVDIIATDSKGKKYNNNKLHELFLRSFHNQKPLWTALPFDTLVTTMRINNWGKQLDLFKRGDSSVYGTLLEINKDADVHFSQRGYYPAEEYELCVSLGKRNVKSNKVRFKVVKYNEEDRRILDLFKQKKEDMVINSYPDNIFTQHVLAQNILFSAPCSSDNSTQYIDQRLNNIYYFLNKYPNSYYIYNQNFLKNLLSCGLLINKDFNRYMDYLKIEFGNTNIGGLLQNKKYISWLKNQIKYD